MPMGETNPDFQKHMRRRDQRITEQPSDDQESNFDYPPRLQVIGSSSGLDRRYGSFSRAEEVVRAWRERNAKLTDESSASASSDNDGSPSSSGQRERRHKHKHKHRAKNSHDGATRSHRFDHSSRDHDELHQSHHSVRNATRELVRSTVTSDDPDRSVLVRQMLDGCRESCRQAGVSFEDILGEDMEGLEVPPLVYEIFTGWEDAGLLQFLLDNTPARHVEMFVRRGCMMRGDNTMFQVLRSALSASEKVDIVRYSLTMKEDAGQFQVEGSIECMPELLARVCTPVSDRKRPLPSPVEWIAAGRMWSIEPTAQNTLILRLLAGEPLKVVDADLTIVARDAASSSGRKNSMAVSMMKDKSMPVNLVPLSQSGVNTILFIPFSPMQERLTLPACLSADGALHFHLSLSFLNPSKSRDSSETEDWEKIAREQDWVLARWSGRGGEAH
ncbi:hypothetical protein DACRYDRAFT_116294 [Dacryopinax primogenitus]|uniref:Uncharacterized protein n=1 Tax=Dacryopinax primogenitus (strain DJM 731) TaxID=1858805 RepID=M5FVL2_DACPD|nr:uncharacterized protein DACRYDRAFT_116294 [Dacryopinax primogenitus]EJU01861.1 hypothetical protein DACRYDRAFT_116294 [Dacryopinax primogenitus]